METVPGPDPATQDRAACLGCGYLLRGLESRQCPECGRPFDPANPTTMRFGKERGVAKEWLLPVRERARRPLRAMLVWAAFLASLPANRRVLLLLLLFLWLRFLVRCGLWMRLRRIALVQFGFPASHLAGDVAFQWVVRGILVATAAFVWLRVTMYPVFWASRPLLTHVAYGVMSDPPSARLPLVRWGGGYLIFPSAACPHGVCLRLDVPLIGPQLAYNPSGTSCDTLGRFSAPLSGGWFMSDDD
jgi:hypothetical protein